MDVLQQLLDEGIIDEVFQQLKTGKEAEVWLVSHRGEPVAAKLYKEREFRSFKNDSGYTEGRTVRNSRTQRAMDRGTSFGKRSAEEAWKSAEADAMYALHAAGVRVPRPVLFYDGVLLMEVIGDAEGRVAPRLVEAGLTHEQAMPLYEHLRGEVIKMLTADLIHGDLSEFNILMGASGPVIIDFPQVVAAARNSSSEKYFRRDLGNLLRFFSGLNPEVSKHAGDVDEIWRAYTKRELSAGYVPSGRPPPKQQAQRPRRDGAPAKAEPRREHHAKAPAQPPQGRQPQGPGRPHEQQARGRPPQEQQGPGRPQQQAQGRPQQQGPGLPQQQEQGRLPHEAQGRPQQQAQGRSQQRQGRQQQEQGAAGPQQYEGQERPQQQRQGRPPQQQNAGRPPQQQDAGRPPQQQNAGRPPQQQNAGRPPQQQNAGRPPQQQNAGRPPQQQGGGRPPQQQKQGPGRPQQQAQGRPPAGKQPAPPRPPRGPEVSFRGPAPVSGRPKAAPDADASSGREGRRRRPRHW
ncbi:MAG: RIO1 family regulatory kinase/ATPase [Myxococcales bacterium]|nr:RIO1 family regulatory kinase/ATPase [Myxococcales bacterium]